MTTPPSLVQRAQQGDAVAIAVLMNDVLQAQEVWVKVRLDSDCLQVMLKAPTVLHQAHCVAFIRRGLLRLQPESIKRVTAYAWRVGDMFPLWIAAFSLEPTPLPQCQPDAPNAMVARSPKTPSSAPSVSEALANGTAVQEQAKRTALPVNGFRQRFELFKLGFMIVLTTIAYFIVIGV